MHSTRLRGDSQGPPESGPTTPCCPLASEAAFFCFASSPAWFMANQHCHCGGFRGGNKISRYGLIRFFPGGEYGSSFNPGAACASAPPA